uniref:RING-type domain-containing protein n=1 Tax=Oryza barthii TaxID=65489 RepID=A0A0D3HR56_9ORYZ
MPAAESCHSRSLSWLVKSCIPADPARHIAVPVLCPTPQPPPPSSPPASPISALPDDLLLECLARVPRASIPPLPAVSRRFATLLASDAFLHLRRAHAHLRPSLLALSVSDNGCIAQALLRFESSVPVLEVAALPLPPTLLHCGGSNRFGSASTNSALNFVTPFQLIRRSHRSSFVPLSSRKPHFPAAAVSISSILFAHTEMHARLLLRMHAPISFAPASSPDAASFAPAAADVGGAVCLGYGIAIAVGVLVFISTVMLASYICVRAKAGAAAVLLADDDDDGGAPAASAVVVLGLDGPAIDALYPKFLHVGVGDDDNACAGAQCAICLGEFVAGDALRRGPGCGHRFHAECVERWLRVSATCPVCRDSPLPSPMATPLAEAVPLAAHAR